jgi:hypothetical protein
MTSVAVDRKVNMATAAIQRAPGLPQQKFKPIIERAPIPRHISDAVSFEPKKHLAFTPPSRVIMMKDIGLPEDLGVSPVAVSEPFQLFSSDAIQQMRTEIMKPEVVENNKYSSNIAACQLRGYAPKSVLLLSVSVS